MTLTWDGLAQPAEALLPPDVLRTRHALADAAKRCDWSAVMELLDESPQLVNTSRPGGASLFAPLHQAAYSNAPTEVIKDLVTRGAWRTLENARGERAVDVAVGRGHDKAAAALAPRLVRIVPHGVLMKIQQHLHAMIRSQEAALIERYPLRLPELQPLLEVGRDDIFFQVPGMYGGFFYRLEEDGVAANLVAIASSRMGGSRYYEITSAGSELVSEGP
ncbi:hypothetical protein MWU77_19060 [Rhodococcus sp. F64268]|uniref:hypothetical protein n=1 Tax=Rhodococcus sp. F64268 TaxID=2926402 RepID=UPI001FF1D858|nr:hypothetical protein [Rhodococcus sp. F64268]MCK0092879.1 hypothetical protein [Rhodococcus sp. F64268]